MWVPHRRAFSGRAIRLTPGTSILDLCSGKGELLCTWARDHGVTGTGVDISTVNIAAARDRATELGVADRVRFVHGNSATYVAVCGTPAGGGRRHRLPRRPVGAAPVPSGRVAASRGVPPANGPTLPQAAPGQPRPHRTTTNSRRRAVSDAERLLADALAAARGTDVRAAERALDRLVVGDPAAVDALLLARLVRAVGRLWPRGWQPVDLDRIATRRLTPRGARLLRDVLAAQRREQPGPLPRWFDDQLTELAARWDADPGWLDRRSGGDRITALRDAVDALGLVEGLPPIALLRPPPGATTTAPRAAAPGTGSRMLDRVRALLAKAESTTFPAEAEALTGKAQELMARHSIDAALLDATAEGPDRPSGVRLGTDAPYAAAKALLIQEVAAANRCESVWSDDLGFATVLGFPADLVAVDLLHTSLLVQATAAMLRGRGERRAGSGRRTRGYDESFLNAFALRIGERLRAATAAEERVAVEERGDDRLLPVLAARSDAVRERVDQLFPGLTRHRLQVRDAEGWTSGAWAADRASLDAGAPTRRAVRRGR